MSKGKAKFVRQSDFKSLPEDIQALIPRGMKAASEKWGCTMTPGDPQKRLGNKSIAKNTQKAYDSFYNGLMAFLAMIGDYESMLILSYNIYDGAPAVNVLSLEAFLKYKRLESFDGPLHDVHGQELKTILGESISGRMYGHRRWSNPDIPKEFGSAISAIHNARDQRDTYLEICKQCLALAPSLRHQGCARHVGAPRCRRGGDPTHSTIWDNALQWSRACGIGYKQKGNVQLLPADIRNARTYLLSQNSIWGLQQYCIHLLSLKIALRSDEYIIVNVEDLIKELCVINEKGVHGLCWKVMGKRDTDYINLTTWTDLDCPDLCFNRHFLVYCYLVNLKKGKVFPCENELKNKREDGHYTESIPYNTFLDHTKHIYQEVGGKVGKIGTHTFRKTYYLFAALGDGKEADAESGARHKSKGASAKYWKDANFIKEVQKVHKNPQNRVSKFKPIRTCGEQSASEVNLPSLPHWKPLHELAADFVHNTLGIGPDHPKANNIPFLCNAIVDHDPDTDPYQQMDECLAKIHPDVALDLRYIFQLILGQEHARAARTPAGATTSNDSNVVGPEFGTSPPHDASRAAAGQTQKRKRGGDFSIPDDKRKKVRQLKGADKVQFILGIVQECSNVSPSDMTEPTRQLLRRLQPIEKCFRNHFDSNMETFITKWGQVQHTTFPCKGDGTACPNE